MKQAVLFTLIVVAFGLSCHLEKLDELTQISVANANFTFDVSNNSGNAPCLVKFTNTSTDAISFEWDFGDGSPKSTEINPVHTYQKSGSYIVTLKASDSNNFPDMENKAIEIKTLTFYKTIQPPNTPLAYGTSVVELGNGSFVLSVNFWDQSSNIPKHGIIRVNRQGDILSEYYSQESYPSYLTSLIFNNEYIGVGVGRKLNDLNEYELPLIIPISQSGSIINGEILLNSLKGEKVNYIDVNNDSDLFLLTSKESQNGGVDIYQKEIINFLFDTIITTKHHEYSNVLKAIYQADLLNNGNFVALGENYQDKLCIVKLNQEIEIISITETQFSSVGTFEKTNNSGFILTVEGECDQCQTIIKINPLGDVMWSKTIINSNMETNCIINISDNLYMLGGSGRQNIGFTTAAPRIIIVDSLGTILDYKDYDPEPPINSYGGAIVDLQETSDGGIIMVGMLSGKIFFAKTDKNGNIQ